MMRRMRSSIIANPFLATVAALIASGVLGCNSCTSCREADKSGASDDGADEAGEGEDDTAAATGGQELPPGADPSKPRRRDFIPITVEEVKPLVPPLTGATFIKEPTAVAGGRRISVHQCVSGNELDKVKAEYEQFLSSQGFKVTPSGRPRKNWHVIRADKENLRISATLRMAEYPDCKQSEKKTKVFIAYFKRLPPRVKAPQQSGQPGAGQVPGQPPGQPGQPGEPAQPGQPGATPPPSQPPPAQPPPARTAVDAGPG